MVLSLLFGKKYAKGQVGSITFDTLVSEEHRFSSRVTTYPVENGAIVSDHIINLPDTIVLSGKVSDTPFNIFAAFNRSISAFNSLVELHRKREVITVVTGIRVYERMAITSLNVPRNIRTGQALDFTIELQRIVYSDDPISIDGTPSVILSDYILDSVNIPFFQSDPIGSLKDQIATPINAGYQALQKVPASFLSSVGLA